MQNVWKKKGKGNICKKWREKLHAVGRFTEKSIHGFGIYIPICPLRAYLSMYHGQVVQTSIKGLRHLRILMNFLQEMYALSCNALFTTHKAFSEL